MNLPKAKLAESEISSRARTILLLTVGATLLLYLLVPYGDKFARPLVLISTMVHELGHGIAAVLIGGDFDKFVMNWDASGTAYWSAPVDLAPWRRAFVAGGGLVGPAVAGALLLVLARRPSRARICLGAFGALLVLAEILVVRNGFGLAFVGMFAAVCLALAIWASEQLAQVSLVFIASQLALSVWARGDYLFTEYAGRDYSDVKHMEQAMSLPYWFWGGVCAAISVAALVLGGWFFVRPARRSSTSRLRPGATKA